jgi:hypothetical protein
VSIQLANYIILWYCRVISKHGFIWLKPKFISMFFWLPHLWNSIGSSRFSDSLRGGQLCKLCQLYC